MENPSGVARSEPFVGRKNQEMFSFLLSQYRIKPQLPSPLAPKDEDMVLKSQRSGGIDLSGSEVVDLSVSEVIAEEKMYSLFESRHL